MLSVCFIARNEEANIRRAIQSVRAIADEIIVADTGSHDRTEEVARELGAAVHRFPWCDDFSAARNSALSRARGDWILWLDADEELLPESVEELKSCLSREDALAFHVRRQDLWQADRPDYYTMMWQLRLFRRRDDLRFQGRCHPHFVPDLSETAEKLGLKIYPSSITLRHHGYVGELRLAKLRRGARLLELELRERPGQLYYMVEYGQTLLTLGDERGHEVLGQALAQVLPRTKEEQSPGPEVALLLEYLFQLPPDRLPAGVSLQTIADLVFRWFPTSAPLLWLLARKSAEAGRFPQAEQLLKRLVQMGKDHSYDQTICFDPRVIGADAKLNLGVCLVRQSKLEEAKQLFTELQAGSERAKEAREYLQLIEQVLGPSSTGTSYSFTPRV